jgi:hypothetical protein
MYKHNIQRTVAIAIYLYNITHTTQFIAYDCSGPRLNMTAFNTLNVDYCTTSIPKKIEQIPIIKLLQKSETKIMKFQSCYIIADYLITRCSALDDAQIVRDGFFSEVIQIGANSCLDTHKKLAYTFPHGYTINKLKINETIYNNITNTNNDYILLKDNIPILKSPKKKKIEPDYTCPICLEIILIIL